MSLLYFRAILEQKKTYWLISYAFKKVSNWLGLLKIKTLRILQGKPTNEKTATTVLRTVIVGIILSTGLVALCHISNQWINVFLQERVGVEPKEFSEEAYIAIVSAAIGVLGVFLGIYFAVLSNIASGPYDGTDRLKDIFLREKASNRYIRFLSTLTIFLLFILGAYYFRLQVMTPSLLVLSILIPYAIFAFIELGKYLFFLSNPAMFFNRLNKELTSTFKKIRHAPKMTKNWTLQEQRYRRIEAKDILDIYESINEYLKKRNGTGLSPENLLLEEKQKAVMQYSEIKSLIPTQSEWFEKTAMYTDWYSADNYKLGVAMQTGTQMFPEFIINEYWFEESIIDSLIIDIKKEDGGSTQSIKRIKNVVVTLSQIVEQMSAHWSISFSIETFKKVSTAVMGILHKRDIQLPEHEKLVLPIIEMITRMPISTLLGFVKCISNISAEGLAAYAQAFRKKRSLIYGVELPRQVIIETEKLYDQIKLEKEIKSIISTPDWFIVESVLHYLDIWCKKAWDSIVEIARIEYVEIGKEVLAMNPTYSAIVYERYNEMAHKIAFHFSTLKNQVEIFEKDQRIGFIEQPNWDWRAENKRIQKIREDAMSKQAGAIEPLSRIPERGNTFPDFLGEAVTNIGRYCYECLKEPRSGGFVKFFGYYFYGIMSIYDRRLKKKKTTSIAELSKMARPLRELLVISGYAYIYSELHEDGRIWSHCKKVWGKYLASSPNALKAIAALLRIMQTDNWTIHGRIEIEFDWETQLSKELERIPKELVNSYEIKVNHSSSLIRKMSANHTGLPTLRFEPIEVFVAKYLTELESAKGLDFGVSKETIDDISKEDNNER